MIEDKLTRDERIRLESLAQANIFLMNNASKSSGEAMAIATRFEHFIKTGAAN